MTSNAEKWRQVMLPSNATIQRAIKTLDLVGIRIILITNADGQLAGTVSDGDIRRGLLRGLDLDSSIESIVYDNPLVVPPKLPRDTVLHLMTANKIQQIPVVDEQRRVVGLHLWDEVTGLLPRSNVMVVMAGGKGTRLAPHTENCPKPMLPIAGRPMLEHIVERAKAEGFSRFIFAIHYLGHMIVEHFGDGRRFGVEVSYLNETSPLGTAGALSLMHPRQSESFIVTNGDLLTDIRYGDLLDFHSRYEAAATMAVRLHEWQHPFGVVHTDGVDIVGFEEKPVARTHINAGVYALDPSALDVLTENAPCDMPTVFERLQATGRRTVAYPMHEPWMDVGRPADLNAANAILGGDVAKK